MRIVSASPAQFTRRYGKALNSTDWPLLVVAIEVVPAVFVAYRHLEVTCQAIQGQKSWKFPKLQETYDHLSKFSKTLVISGARQGGRML